MKGKLNFTSLAILNVVLLTSGILFASWTIFVEVREAGWSSNAWQLLFLGAVLFVTTLLSLLRLLQDRGPERLFAEHSHILQTHANGKVVLAGHRISLYRIMKDLHEFQGSQNVVPKLHDLYPTVPVDLLREVVNFCERYSRQLERYFREQEEREKTIARRIEKRRAGLSLEELHKRKDEERSSAAGNF